jgi:hypothetical protein
MTCSDFFKLFQTEPEAIAFENGVLAGISCSKDPISSELLHQIYGVQKGTNEEPSPAYWEWLIKQALKNL